MIRRSIIELIFLGVILLLILWWFFGGAAFAAWMTAYNTEPAEIQSWKFRFYANIIMGILLVSGLMVGYIKLGANRKRKP